MKRVMIIGSPGTGKSTFAKKLAENTGLPLIHLDFYYHDKSKGYYNDKVAWQARVEELTAQNSWIIDGNYGKTMAVRMKRADTIFYFDMPRRTAIMGALKRWISPAKRTDMPNDWQEKAGWSFLKYIWTFRKTYAAGTQDMLNQNDDKHIIIFKNRKQLNGYLGR